MQTNLQLHAISISNGCMSDKCNSKEFTMVQSSCRSNNDDGRSQMIKTMQCTVCSFKWRICRPCLKFKDTNHILMTASNLGRHLESGSHKQSIHRIQQMRSQNMQVVTGTNSLKREIDALFDKNNKRDEYFRNLFLHDVSGVDFLVARSLFARDFDFENDKLDYNEARTDFFTCKILNHMPQRDRHAVQYMNKMWYDIGARHKEHDMRGYSFSHRRIMPSQSFNEQDQRYFRATTSITQNMPHPIIEHFGEHHACTNVGGCLKDALARGTPMSLMSLDDVFATACDTVRLPKQSNRARRVARRSLLKSLGLQHLDCAIDMIRADMEDRLQLIGVSAKDVFVSLFVVWTDGIEPNAVKKDRNSVWAGSVTFIPERRNWNW